MLYLPINRSWLFSLTARRVYLVSALLAIALTAILIGVHTAMAAARMSALTPLAAALVRGLLYPEILGTALLWAAMWYFWLGFDRSHYLKRAIWFCCLFFLAPVGPVLYYFAVYRRSASLPNAQNGESQPQRSLESLP
jgi:hypothetical protein